MTLQEAKNKVANRKGFNTWKDLHVYVSVGPAIYDYLDEAAELYAKAKWEEAIEEMRCISELDSDVELPKFEP